MISPKISIMVPVYNSEKTITRCIDSILNQKYSNLEILIIDDGSFDNSSQLSDRYKTIDNRVRVFHKTNSGVGSSRQFALEVATGDFLTGVDSDDYIEPEMYQDMVNKLAEDKSSVVVVDFFVETIYGQRVNCQKTPSVNSNDILKAILLNKMHGSICNKLISMDLIKRSRANFPVNINYCEDVLFLCKLLILNSKVSYINKAYYHYDVVSYGESLTRCFSRDFYFNQYIPFINELEIRLADEHMYDILRYKKLEAKNAAIKSLLFSKSEVTSMLVGFRKDILKSNFSFLNKLLLIIVSFGGYPIVRCIYRFKFIL